MCKGVETGGPSVPLYFYFVDGGIFLYFEAVFSAKWVCVSPSMVRVGFDSLNFADEFFLLCCGTIESLNLLKSALEDFGAQSRLKPNIRKSNMFVSSVDKGL